MATIGPRNARWLFVLGLALTTFASCVEVTTDSEALKALTNKNDPVAFPLFVKAVVILRPHPDPAMEGFIQQAERGDLKSFALIAYDTWQGAPGFRRDFVAGKMALMRVEGEGEATGAYFLGRSFFTGKPSNDKYAQIDDFVSGIKWYGLAAGMGESRGYTEAIKMLDQSKLTGETRQGFIDILNQAMEDGKKEAEKRARSP